MTMYCIHSDSLYSHEHSRIAQVNNRCTFGARKASSHTIQASAFTPRATPQERERLQVAGESAFDHRVSYGIASGLQMPHLRSSDRSLPAVVHTLITAMCIPLSSHAHVHHHTQGDPRHTLLSHRKRA